MINEHRILIHGARTLCLSAINIIITLFSDFCKTFSAFCLFFSGQIIKLRDPSRNVQQDFNQLIFPLICGKI